MEMIFCCLSDNKSNIPETNPPTNKNISILGRILSSTKLNVAEYGIEAIDILISSTLIVLANLLPTNGIFLIKLVILDSILDVVFANLESALIIGDLMLDFKAAPVIFFATALIGTRKGLKIPAKKLIIPATSDLDIVNVPNQSPELVGLFSQYANILCEITGSNNNPDGGSHRVVFYWGRFGVRFRV